MLTTRRWQDWAIVIVGLVLFLSPFAFATGLTSVEAWAAYILGGLITLVGVASIVWPSFSIGGAIQTLLAVVAFISPWLLGFSAVTGMLWAACAAGAILVLLVGSEFASGEGRQVAHPV